MLPWYDLPLCQINIAMYTVYFFCLLLFHVPMTLGCMTMYKVLTDIFDCCFVYCILKSWFRFIQCYANRCSQEGG